MPFYKENLLSAWGSDQVFEIGQPPLEVDTELTPTLTKWGLMAKNPGKKYRNQIQPKVQPDTNGKDDGQRGAADRDPLGPYANVRIKYGSHGISGFDFQLVQREHNCL